MQQDIERFYEKCLTHLGWGYDPTGRHIDISNVQKAYMEHGCMWCLCEDNFIIGTVAVKNISIDDAKEKIAELKRMFVLAEYQGKGYGRLLLETAIHYSCENGFDKLLLDTRLELHAAVHLYHKYGFVGIPSYNDNAKAELYMELPLH